jgi:hypothetical protein
LLGQRFGAKAVFVEIYNMKKYLILVLIYCILSNYNVFSQESTEDSNFTDLGSIWQEADRGTIITERPDDTVAEIDDDAMIVEILFENNYGKKIFYEGAKYRGYGTFYSERNGERIAILETPIRYGPAIIWHGENVAEIIIPTGSPFTHSCFYNFSENKLSERYDFPVYYDIENDYVLIWGIQDFELYNVLTNTFIREYEYRRNIGGNFNTLAPIIDWFIEKENKETIIMHWKTFPNNTGTFIMDL